MDKLDQETLEAVRQLLRYSWTDIDFKWEELTDVEKKLVTPMQFEKLVQWVKGEQ